MTRYDKTSITFYMLGLILTMNQKRELMLFHVYILSNKQRGILYIGITNNLARRIYEHKQKIADGFSKKYNLTISNTYILT